MTGLHSAIFLRTAAFRKGSNPKKQEELRFA